MNWQDFAAGMVVGAALTFCGLTLFVTVQLRNGDRSLW